MEIGLHILFGFIGLIIGLALGCKVVLVRCRTCKHFRLDEAFSDKEGRCKFDSTYGTTISDCDKCYCGNYEIGKYFQ